MTARVLLWVTLVGLALVDCAPNLCERGPRWSLDDGIVPMDMTRGEVTVLAPLAGSTPEGISEARKLERLYRQVKNSGHPYVEFMIINDENDVNHFIKLYSTVTFSVIQDKTHLKIRDQLEASNMDVLIYDREGRLVKFLPYEINEIDARESLIHQAILDAYNREPCCDTTSQHPPTTVTQVPQEIIEPSSFSFWNIFKYWFEPSEKATVAPTLPSITTPAPTSQQSESCDDKTRNRCKIWSNSYLNLSKHCCEDENTELENCEEFDESKCYKMAPFVRCCLRTNPPSDVEVTSFKGTESQL